jgi:divalent metal cation (Fe/Co/Zn/Cd) transporter
MDGKDDISNVIREKKAARVTWVGFFTNLILSAAKIIAGIWGRSSAMIADGIHSLSDFITDFIVIIFIKIG